MEYGYESTLVDDRSAPARVAGALRRSDADNGCPRLWARGVREGCEAITQAVAVETVDGSPRTGHPVARWRAVHHRSPSHTDAMRIPIALVAAAVTLAA